ncbi:MAG: hypothetical protein Kow0020_04360 [Wenzhouxiangellaceae bacterium]
MFRSLALSFLMIVGADAARADEVRFIADPGWRVPAEVGAEALTAYAGGQVLYRIDRSRLSALQSATGGRGIRVLEQADLLLFDAGVVDTSKGGFAGTDRGQSTDAAGFALSVVQFVGPIRQQWLDDLERAGVRPVHYVANHGYLVWADAKGRERLARMSAERRVLQFSDVLPSSYRIGPALRQLREKSTAETIRVRVQMIAHDDYTKNARAIESLAQARLADWSPVLGFVIARFEVRREDIQHIAEMPDVYWIEADLPRELYDEVQNMILAGDLVPDQSGPTGPGYEAFLNSLGFPTDPAEYPVLVVVDDGVGDGTLDTGDPTLHESGDASAPTRVVFNTVCTGAASAESIGGHGHINASIAGGFDDRAGFPFRDPNGFQRGQGVNPYARLAGTRVFSPSFSQAACGGNDTGLIQHTWQQGARISTNSWGCSGCAGSYDDSSQAFDAGVRDADPGTVGNQELLHLFAAGNSGSSAGTVGTPGNAKNVLTVGASENRRPSDEDGNWSDGCAVGPTGADDAMDVIGFSSRGPAPGNRVKPETIAPGTHIQGTASTSSAYDGSSVCDQFRPSAQSVFAASSGTSHSTPAVAGLSTLVWWWLENATNLFSAESPVIGTPTPALLKAYILAHPTYLTGVSANDSLPSNSQGYGMPNMSTLFDDALKVVVNQDVLFDNSGESWDLVVSVADPTRPVRVMMVYTDQPGAIGTSPQVNNLDLVVNADGTDYLGNVFSGQWSTPGGTPDANNNYEAVFLPAGAASALTITVSAFNIAGDGVPAVGDATDQDFALVCYNCAMEPTFTLQVDPSLVQVCTPDPASWPITVGSVLGFTDPVTLSLSGEPAGTTVAFSGNPVTPPGGSVLTIGNTQAAAAGSYTLNLQGVSGTISRTLDLSLDLFTQPASAPALTTPADGALNVSQTPLLGWNAATQASTYFVEVATDPGFTNVVFSQVTSATSLTVTSPLPSNTELYWRVTAGNSCGDGVSMVRSFVTEALPGDCSIGSEAVIAFADDMESGATGWATAGTGSTWQLQGAQVQSGANAWHAVDVDSVTDQYLISPAISLPAANAAHTLQFWNRQVMEDRAGGCYDGGLVEVSVDAGATWQPLPASAMLTDPYDGPISSGFSNPAGGLDAWCGDPQDWLNSVVDVSAYAGQTVQFRFRLATDSSVGREGWYIDDVKVQSCATESLFSDGFESP